MVYGTLYWGLFYLTFFNIIERIICYDHTKPKQDQVQDHELKSKP